MKELSPGQRRAFAFIREFIREHGMAPTLRDMCRGMGFTSTNNANDYMSALERKGYIRRAQHRHRGLTVLCDENGLAATQPAHKVIFRGECFDCGAALFGVPTCPMCALGLGRKAS